jgi:hypothetical protein
VGAHHRTGTDLDDLSARMIPAIADPAIHRSQTRPWSPILILHAAYNLRIVRFVSARYVDILGRVEERQALE